MLFDLFSLTQHDRKTHVDTEYPEGFNEYTWWVYTFTHLHTCTCFSFVSVFINWPLILVVAAERNIFAYDSLFLMFGWFVSADGSSPSRRRSVLIRSTRTNVTKKLPEYNFSFVKLLQGNVKHSHWNVRLIQGFQTNKQSALIVFRKQSGVGIAGLLGCLECKVAIWFTGEL